MRQALVVLAGALALAGCGEKQESTALPGTTLAREDPIGDVMPDATQRLPDAPGVDIRTVTLRRDGENLHVTVETAEPPPPKAELKLFTYTVEGTDSGPGYSIVLRDGQVTVEDLAGGGPVPGVPEDALRLDGTTLQVELPVDRITRQERFEWSLSTFSDSGGPNAPRARDELPDGAIASFPKGPPDRQRPGP